METDRVRKHRQTACSLVFSRVTALRAEKHLVAIRAPVTWMATDAREIAKCSVALPNFFFKPVHDHHHMSSLVGSFRVAARSYRSLRSIS